MKLINDNCHALGSKYKNNKSYAVKYANIVTHSYHPVKNITTGEGGAVLTNNPKLKKSTGSQNDGNTPNRAQKNIYSSNKYKEEVKTVLKNNFGYEINSSNTNSFDKIIKIPYGAIG